MARPLACTVSTCAWNAGVGGLPDRVHWGGQELSDRGYVIADGRVVLEGPWSERLVSDEVRQAYLVAAGSGVEDESA